MNFSYTIGDVFCCEWRSNKRYFQFVAVDKAQCDSPVVRVFERPYYSYENPSTEEIVASSVFLYAHTAIVDGVEKGLWEKVGHSDEIGDLSHVLFKDPGCDFRQRISETWSVWHINELPHRYIGKMTDEYRRAIPGDILPYDVMETGIIFGRIFARPYPKSEKMRVVTNLGSVFCVPVNDRYNRYLQYIGLDRAQLNSEMIRVFKTSYPADTIPDIETIVSDEVDFYAHTLVRAGVYAYECYKVGTSKNIGNIDRILFSNASIPHDDSVSTDFYIWHPNELPHRYVGILSPEYWHADPGSVMPWSEIAARIRYGRYMYVKPRYK